MIQRIRKSFSAKLMLLTGLILIMPAVTYLAAVLIASSSIKQFYVRIIDEYGQSEKEGEEFVLEQETKRWIKRISIDVARQLDLFLEVHPEIKSGMLSGNAEFCDLAIQPVGENGYTVLIDVTSKKIILHPDSSFEGKPLAALMPLPGLEPILDRVIAGKFGEGDYIWSGANNTQILKYLFATPVPRLTADSHRLAVAATAGIDDLIAPARQRSQGQAVKHILNIIENRRTRDLLTYSLLASVIMGAALIVIAALLLRKGIEGLDELVAASTEVAGGRFDIEARKITDDEFGEVATAFNQMARVLNETVISRNYYERAKIDAEKADRLKSEFLTNISHEIRTPLNGIIGFSEVLLEGEKEEDRRGHLQHIIQCGRNLLALINDILNLSKMEAGKIKLNIGPVDLKDLAVEAAAIFEPVSLQKGLELRVTFDSDLPEEVSTDGLRVRQILVNLLDNAIKFTRKGEVALHIEPNRSKRKGGILFTIRDTGIGIAEDKHGVIFTSFTRVAPESMSSEEGTGLGLAISANLAGLLGGEIWLESGPGKGSKFFFTIGG